MKQIIVPDGADEQAYIEKWNLYHDHIDNNGWISVDESLPIEYDDVLVWYRWYNREADDDCEWYGVSYYGNGKWNTVLLKAEYPKVLYWMPLPAPPRIGE